VIFNYLTASKGFLHASHFCYLMAHVGFGSYTRKSSKIVLIGSSHGLPLEYFATNQAIQCTEIFEYGRSLGSDFVLLNNFQVSSVCVFITFKSSLSPILEFSDNKFTKLWSFLCVCFDYLYLTSSSVISISN